MAKWITFEGGEGVGKSTQIQKLQDWLLEKNIPHISTREPGGTPEAEAIRNLFLTYPGWSAFSESCLMSAARDNHFQNIIKPALDAGKWVLCDRFFDSTVAYQHYGHGMDINFLENLYNKSMGESIPDVTFLLDMEIDDARERCRKRFDYGEKAKDRFDDKSTAFFEKIRSGFLDIASNNPERVVVLDASRDTDQVFESIIEHVAGICRAT